MRSDLEHNKAREVDHHSALFGTERQALSGNVVLPAEATFAHFFDPNGANRTVTLPTYKRGRLFLIAHIGSDYTLSVSDSGGNAVVTIRAGEMHILACSGNEWRSTSDVFGAAGASHATGLVPDPGAVSGLNRFLMDDGTWTSVTTAGIVDAYKYVADGTNTATASGLSQFKLRSSDSAVAITVTNNDATHGDNADFTINEAAVNHNTLLNFVANEHVDHSAVSITTAANSGLAGGGTIAATRSLSVDINNLASATPVLADSLAFYDLSGLVTAKATFTTLNGILDHNALLNYDANRHVDHTTVSIATGVGLTGGGTIAATRTISLDFTSLTAETTVAAADLLVFYDASEADHNKITFTNFNAALDHDALLNFVANEHIDHTAVTLTAGTGLSGGGTIAANRSFALADMAAYTLKGRNAGTTGAPGDIDISLLTEKTTLANDDLFLIQDSAASNAFKKVKKSNISPTTASTTEVLTGTDTAKAVTADALAALWEKGADVASAATISLGEGGVFHVTGTTTITDIDFTTAKDGRAAILIFDASLTLTYNATTLKLPGAASIVTQANDCCLVVQDSSDNVHVVWYQRASFTREVLTANRTYYVRTDGSDSNTGLANTAGGAFLTIQKAIDTVASIDLASYNVTIQVGSGTYTGANTLKSYVGAGPVTIQGDTTTPANVLISTTSAACFAATAVPQKWVIKGFEVRTTTSGYAFNSSGGSQIYLDNIKFGACASGHMVAQQSAYIEAIGTFQISGNAPRHLYALQRGYIYYGFCTITVDASLTFSAAFVECKDFSLVMTPSTTFSSTTATGTKYDVGRMSLINTNGAGTSFFPGTAASGSGDGGTYDQYQ